MAHRFRDTEADLLRRYIAEIESHPRLSPEEEAELVLHAATDDTGSHESRRRLIQSHLRLVVEIAHRLEHRGVPLLDLIQEGNLGLMRAVDRLDEDSQVCFADSVTWYVRQAMNRLLCDAAATGRAVAPFDPGLQPAYVDPPGYAQPDDPADLDDPPLATVRPLMAVAGDARGSSAGPGPYDLAAEALEREALELQLDWLSPREQMVLRLRFGLDETGELTIDRLTEQFDITKEHVRQIEKKAMTKLRHPSVAKLWSIDQRKATGS